MTIGKPIAKIGGLQLALGRTRFSEDMVARGFVSLKLLRSPSHHAKIRRLNITPSMNIKGVLGVLTWDHIPGEKQFGLIIKDQPLLAHEKVRFKGEPIALVVAENEEAAAAALDAIELELEELPPLLDPLEALTTEAAPIHEGGNLLSRRTIKKGDVEEALLKCHIRVKHTYRTPHLEHAYLEPDAGIGYIDQQGRFVIHASTQNPHYDQQEVSRLLGIEKDKVRIIQAPTGGGFGSKLDLTVQGFIALALYHFRRPASLILTREECFLATPKRHPFIIEMETGADKKGKLLAIRAKIICDTGAYASYGPAVASRAAVHATGPYFVPNVEVESVAVYTHNPVAGAMRGFGAPQIAFAYESQMDSLARALGMDPLEIRKLNALAPGAQTATGQTLSTSVGILKSLEAVEPYYQEAKRNWAATSPPERKRGIGIGSMWYGIGNTGIKNPASAKIQMDLQGNVTLFTGAADIGQGSTTVLAQTAAKVLGLEPYEIQLIVADTGLTPNAGATSASRQTYISGNAVRLAAQALAEALLNEASTLLEVPTGQLYLEDGFVRVRRKADLGVSFKDLASSMKLHGHKLCFEGRFDPATTSLDPETGQGVPYATYAFATQVAMVEVDTLTGQVFVEKVIAAHDVGKAINPLAVEGQIHGGILMGIGFGLMEEFLVDHTVSMAEYHIPTALDVPQITATIVEDKEPSGPFGAKGVGEPALIPTAPAIINAIAQAIGKRIFMLPAKPERVWELLKEG